MRLTAGTLACFIESTTSFSSAWLKPSIRTLYAGRPADPIPKPLVGFEAQVGTDGKPCPDGVLPAGTQYFRVVVVRIGLHSGCYTGKVLIATEPPAGTPTAVAVDIEL